MSGKRVLIVSSNGLFREGLKHILANTADFTLTRQISALQEAEEIARSNEVDVVIIDQADEAGGRESRAAAIARLLTVPNIRVITVGLDTGDLLVYKQERVEEASVEDLVAALNS
jgi:DNA-binding NarL/FixJ family response regulator